MTAFSVPENLAFDDYTSLIAFIGDWMDRSDLSGSAPSMIALCEARLRRELAPLFHEANATVSTVNGASALPSDCDFVRSVTYAGADGTFDLREVGPDAGRDYKDGATPWAYSLEANQLRVWPSCDVPVSVLYQTKLTRLSEANPSNTLLSQHPDLYFYGAMLFAEGYLANDQRASLFKALWDEALAEAKRFFLRQRRKTMGLGRPRIVV